MIWIGIPTGDRTKSALECVKAWKPFAKVAVYTWDDKTYEAVKDIADWVECGERKSFAILQNYMSSQVNFDGYICGADDLFPYLNCGHLDYIAKRHDGKALFIHDNVNSTQPCHPVITRGWYEEHKPIFDEKFIHNCCDTDLYYRLAHTFEQIHAVKFDHRHWLVGKRKKDAIDKIALDAWEEDKKYLRAKIEAAKNTKQD